MRLITSLQQEEKIFSAGLSHSDKMQEKNSLKGINLFPGTNLRSQIMKVLTGEYLINIGLTVAPGRANSLLSNIFELVAE